MRDTSTAAISAFFSACTVCLSIVCTAYSADEPVEFTNVSPDIGLSGTNANFITWADYDNDGDLDMLADPGLFRNNGKETGVWNFTNVTAESNIAGRGVWADYDRDGDLDCFGTALNQNNGDGTFTNVTATAFPEGLPWPEYITCAGWADYDKDGYPDLYIGRGEIWDYDNGSLYFPDQLWHNEQNGTFTNVTTPAGLSGILCTDTVRWPGNPRPNYARGINWVDYNNDGWEDVYVTNYRQVSNYLFKNNGNGTFTNTAPATGCLHDGPQDNTDNNNVDPYNRAGHTIGACWGDIDNDGDFDVWVNNFNHKDTRVSDDGLLCRNNGGPDWTFTNFAGTAGIHRKPWASGGGPQGEDYFAGCAFGDYDNDGDLDLWIAQTYDRDLAYSYLYRQDGLATQHFTQVANATAGNPMCLQVWNTYAGVFVDYDNDGDLDLITGGKYPFTAASAGEYMIRVFNNGGNGNNWLQFELRGDDCDKNGIGAKIKVETAELTLWDWIKTSQGGHNHSNGQRAYFGLGKASVDSATVTVYWPCGREETERLRIDSLYTWQEGLPVVAKHVSGSLQNAGAPRIDVRSICGGIIEVSVVSAAAGIMTIRDASGKLVKRLKFGSRGEGQRGHEGFSCRLNGNGRVGAGEKITGGVYFVTVAADKFTVTKPVSIVR